MNYLVRVCWAGRLRPLLSPSAASWGVTRMGKPSRTRPSAWWKGHGGAKRARDRPDRNAKPLAELLAEWSGARPGAPERRGEDDAEAEPASPEPEPEAAPGPEAELEPEAGPEAEAG